MHVPLPLMSTDDYICHASENTLASMLMRAGDLMSTGHVYTLIGNGERGSHQADGRPLTSEPFGLATGPDGALYYCDLGNHKICRFIDGLSEKVVGRDMAGNDGSGGVAEDAAITEPYELCFDREGNLWFVDMKAHVVRKVDAMSGIIETVVGSGRAGFSGDGDDARKAQLCQPHSIAFGPDGKLYIADIGNHRIRRYDPDTDLIETWGGSGKKGMTLDGSAIGEVDLYGPRAMVFDKDGSMILALREGNALYRITDGHVAHLAGTSKFGYEGDRGPASAARLAGPKGLAVAENGCIYLADTESHTVRCVFPDGTIDTVLGDGTEHDGPDGDPATCGLARPHGVHVDAQNRLWVGDSDNHRIRCLPLGDDGRPLSDPEGR